MSTLTFIVGKEKLNSIIHTTQTTKGSYNTDMEIEIWLGTAGILFTSAQLIPQLIKVYQTRRIEDLSIWMLTIIFLGAATWLWYAIIIQDLAILVANSINLVAALVLLIFKISRKAQ